MRYVVIVVALTAFILYDFGMQEAAMTEAIVSELVRIKDIALAALGDW